MKLKICKKRLVTLLCFCVGTLFLQAQSVPFTQKYSDTLRGNVHMISNAIIGLNGVQPQSHPFFAGDGTNYNPNNSYNGGSYNDGLTINYIDIDSDPSTFSSSSADINLPSGCETIKYAGLYWSATYYTQKNSNNSPQLSNLPFPDPRPDFRTVRFRPPGSSYITIPASQTQVIYDGYRNTFTNPNNNATNDVPYVCYADVTNIVTSLANFNGTYTVANVRSTIGATARGSGASAGWILVVAYEDNSLPSRMISSQDGFLEISGTTGQNFSYNNFITLPAPNPVRARYGVATLEGDFGITGDGLQITNTFGGQTTLFANPVNPPNNFFNSSISVDGAFNTLRNPASENTLGFDVDIFNINNPGNSVIGNNQTAVNFRATTNGDRYRIFFNLFAIDIIEPELKVKKKVLDVNGIDITGQPVNFADQLFYELTIENQGNEDITAATIRDVLPANVDFTLGSITTSNPGIVATPNGTNREINITIDDALIVRNGGGHTVRFGVSVVATCADLRDACSNEINNVAISTYTGVDSGLTRRGEESILDQDLCNTDTVGSSNVLINNGICFTETQPAFICTGSLTLTAGASFTRYEWVNANNPGVIIGTNRELVVTVAGTYIVTEFVAPTCQDSQQTFEVDAFNTIEHPVVDIVNGLDSNPNVNGNLRTCAVTGEELPEIFLCGTGTSLNIPINFPVGTTVVWERMDPAACPSVVRDPDCPTIDAACNGDWVQVSTDIGSYTVTQAGEYRIRATFDANCTIPFYFNVFQNNFDPDLVVIRQIICGTPGTIRVQNSSNQYEYQLVTPLGTVIGYQLSPEFTGLDLRDVGNYTVNVRQRDGLPTACVFQDAVFLDELDATETVTATSPTCPGDRGEISITVADSQINYTYIINSTTTAFTDTEGPTTIPSHVFTGLVPDTYEVQVLSADGSCSEVFTRTVNAIAPFSATIRLVEDLHCNPDYQPDPTLNDPGHPNYDSTALPYDPDQFIAIYEVTVTGGSGNFAFNNQVDFLGTTLAPLGTTTYQFRATTAGNYPVYVNDLDNSCTIFAGSVDVNPYTSIAATAAPTDPVCPTGTGSILVNITAGEGPFTYILDQGTANEVTIGPTVSTSETFNNVDTSISHVVTVQDQFGCDLQLPPINFTAPTAITANIALTQDYQCNATGSSVPAILGEITVSGASGGNGSYEYSIDGVDFTNTTGVFTGLTDGTYTLYIRDTNTAACPVNLGSIIIEPLQVVTDLTFAQTQVQCPGLTSDITLTATGSNGAVPPTNFEYQITAPIVRPWQASNVFTGIPAGATYTFESRILRNGGASNACVYSENYTIDTIDAIAVSTSITADPTCDTDPDASFTFTVTGIDLTSTTYSYDVSGGTITGSLTGNTLTTVPVSIPGIGAGTYDIVITDDTTLCTATTQVIITDPADLTIDPPTTTPAGCGINDGTITVTANGGRGGYQYELRNAAGTLPAIVAYQGTNSFTGLAPGTYTVFVRDGNTVAACEESIQAIVGEELAPVIALATGGDPCYDPINRATQWVTITPGVAAPIGPFTYSLDGGAPVAVTFLGAPAPANTFEIPNLTPGAHTISVINTASVCPSNTINFTINEELLITAALDNDLTCTNDANISFTVTPGTGIAPYVFDVMNAGTNTVFLGGVTSPVAINTGGTYEIRVTDGQNCTATSSPIVVTPYIQVVAGTTAVNPFCAGDRGSITVSITAGDGPFIYTLNQGTPGQVIVGPTGATSTTFNNVIAGNHVITITDGDGCPLLAPLNETITDPPAITANIALTQDYQCNATGSSVPAILGEITVSGASGGNGSYEYSIDGVDFTNTTGVFTGLTDGTYTLYIRDTNTAACPVNLGSITIEPLQVVTDLTFAQTQVQCPGLTSDITLTATGSNGAVPPTNFEYQITTPIVRPWQASNVFTGIPAGATYTFESRILRNGGASNACVYSENYTIDTIDAIAVSASITADPTCDTDPDASFTFTVTGIDLTSTTYSYDVSGGTIAGSLTGNTLTTVPVSIPGIGAGTYDIVITDDTTLCTATTQVIITDPADLTIDPPTTTPAGCGINDGTITVTANGGRGGYQYELRNAAGTLPAIVAYQGTNSFTGLAPGTYTVFVRDGNTVAACEESIQAIVGEELAPVIALATGGDPCYDPINRATQWVTITPGVAAPIGPFTYSLDGGAPVAVTFLGAPAPANTFEIPNLTSGAHTISVTNTASVCPSNTINFTVNDQLTITAVLDNDLTCIVDAQINVITTGGNGATSLEININGGGFNPYLGAIPFTTNIAGTYQFRVIDSASPTACTAESAVITVNPAPDPVVNAPTITNPTCNGDSDGAVVINIDTTVGTGPYEVNFDGLGFSNQTTYGGLIEGTYNYTVRDAKGCTDTFSVTLSAPPVIVDNTVVTDIVCNGSGITLGQIDFNGITGGVPLYSLSLLNAADLSLATTTSTNPVAGVVAGANVSFGGLSFGNYILRVIDANNCNYDFTGTISTTPIFNITSSVSGVCSGGVTATINVTGGTGPFQIREYTPGGTEPYVNLVPGPTTHVFTNLPFDTPFTFEVLDTATNCTDIRTLAPPPNPSTIDIALVENPVTCVGSTDGSIDYTITNYQGTELTYSIYRSNDLVNPLTVGIVYSAGNPQTVVAGGTATGNVSAFEPGTYLIRVEETDGTVVDACNTAAEFTIVESATPFAYNATSIIDGHCNASSQGIVSVTGGTGPYGFLVVESGNPNPGTYSTSNVVILDQTINLNWDLYVTDANNCELGPFPLTATVIPDPAFTSVPAFVVDPCINDSMYPLTVIATGQSQLQFGIDDGDTGTPDAPVFVDGTPTGNPNEYTFTYNITNVSANSHTLTIRDVNGCTDTATITIYPELIVTATMTEPTCRDNDGTIIATVSGGSDITANPGNFTFTLLDGGGLAVAGVTQTPGPGADQITFTSTTIPGATGILPGDYTVEVNDSAIGPNPPAPGGCTASFDITVPTFLDPIPSGAPTPVSCFGGNDGTILVSLDPTADDNAPYTYIVRPFGGGATILGPQADPLFTGLPAGSYEVVATSDKGCEGTSLEIIIGGPTAALNVVSSQTSYGCNVSNVEVFPIITLTITDGTPDYDVSYTGAATGSETDVADADGNPANGVQYEVTATVAGTYTFTVTDNNNCAFANFDVIVPAFPIMTDPTVTRDTAAVNAGVISCDNPETVIVSITGGTGPFDFVEISGSGTPPVPSQLGVVAGTGNVDPPVGVQTTATFTLPSIGNYKFRITDQGTGCFIETSEYRIAAFDDITAALTTLTDVLCAGATTGELSLNIGGYTGAYNYTVTNTGTGAVVVPSTAANTTTNPLTISGLSGGTYQVSVEALDTPFCDEVSNTTTINQPTELALIMSSATIPHCNDLLSTVTMQATGGVGSYSFAAVAGAAPQVDPGVYPLTEVFDLDPATNTTWVIFVEDANGCVISEEITIPAVVAPPVLDPIPGFVDDPCTFDNDYIFTVTATTSVVVPPGSGDLSYELTHPSGVVDTPVRGNGATVAEHQFTVSVPGTYSIRVFDENGCPSTPQTITIYPELIVTATMTEPTCRDNDGTIIATVSGGSDITANPGNFTFTLLDGGGLAVAGVTQTPGPGADQITFTSTTIPGATGILPGDYTVEVNDSAIGPNPPAPGGCTASFDITVPTFLDPIPSGAPTPVSCFGGNDGTILVSLDPTADDNAPYTYIVRPFGGGATILGPQADPLFTGLPAGSYEVVATSDKGCEGTSLEIIIGGPTAALNVVSSQTSYGCNVSNVEVFPIITLTITDGTPDYDVSYTGAATGSETDVADADGNPANGVQYEVTATVAGTYTFTVTDNNNCAFANFDVIVPAFPIMTDPTVTRDTAAVNAGVISCDNPETVIVSITGGTGPFDFVEISGSGTPPVPSQLGVVAGTGNVDPPVGVQTTATFTLPSIGNYKFRITDQGTGCFIETSEYRIAAFDDITAALTTLTDVLCAGATTGELSLNIGGYTGAYNYTVTNTGTGAVVVPSTAANTTTNPLTISGLSGGTYQVSVEALDTPFCDEVSNTTTINQPTPITVTVNQIQDETCNPGDDATVEAVAAGGTGAFQYQLETSGGAILVLFGTDPRFGGFGLDAGVAPAGLDYVVRVRDANNCEATGNINIQPPVPIGLDPIAPTILACADSEDGVIVATATGGQGAGTYFFMLTFPDGSQSGRLSSTTDTYRWEDLKPGNYIVTVSDNLNCEIDQNPVVITVPTPVEVSVVASGVSCTLPSPTTITVTGSGGTPGPGYTYFYIDTGGTEISNTSGNFNGLPQGDYDFFVRDANGCESPASNRISVRNPIPLDFDLNLSNTSIVCFSEPTGSIDAVATGGLGNYRYQVTGTDYLGNPVELPGPVGSGNTQTTSFFGDLLAGNYQYIVFSDDPGPPLVSCNQESKNFIITQPLEFIIDVVETPISCNGETDGSIRVFVEVITPPGSPGGTAPYFYSLYNSAGNAVYTFLEDDIDGITAEHTFIDLPADTYRVEVEDNNGCPREEIDIIIIEPEAIVATITATTPEDCAGDMNGTANVSITGGLPPANPADPSYFWSIDGVNYQPVSDPANLFIDNLPGGTTTLFIRDSQNNANCQGAFNIEIESGVNLGATLIPRLVCPVYDYTDPRNPIMTREEQYFVEFSIIDDSRDLGIIYTLNGINGTPNPSNNSNLTGVFEVVPGEYEGAMEFQGCIRTVDTIEIFDYAPLAIPVAQMTGNSQDPNEYQIIASGGRRFEKEPFYSFSFTILEEGITLEELEPSDFTELDGNIFTIRETADYVLRVVDADGCEVLTVQNITYINIRIPNYFTPDSPNTSIEERFWYPRQITPNLDDPFFFENMEVMVFDRYGRMLAEFKGDQQGWDGLYQGKQLPSGDYWYTIILNDIDNREFTGHFTLYR
ncbi:T9SS type B sorting domain-containing protein [Aquimarina muelleri]|uniref:T9SS type B sorting domain-containing protein n=1 Tax=Aquimarina muelleri TaxID=279356 RepID=UPI003F689494